MTRFAGAIFAATFGAKFGAKFGALICAAFAVALSTPPGAAAQDARAAAGQPYKIGVFLENYQERCYSIGFGDAVRRFVEIEVERINRRDGVAGRPIEPIFIEERQLGDLKHLSAEQNEARKSKLRETLRTQILEAAQTGELLGFVGPSLSGVNRVLFGQHGAELDALGVPFIVRTSDASALSEFRNVFVARPDDLERAEPIADFIAAQGARKVFFAIRSSNTGRPGRREKLLEKVQAALGEDRIAGFHVIEAKRAADWERRDFLPDSVDALVAKIKASAPDMVFLSVGYAARAAQLADRLREEGVAPPLFFDARLAAVVDRMKAPYPAAIFSATRPGESLPAIANSALDAVTSRGSQEDWIFSGQLNAAFAARTPNGCDGATERRALDFISKDAPRNSSRIAAGAAAADMVRLVAEAAAGAGGRAQLETRRRAVLTALSSRYLEGRGVFEGSYGQWSFYSTRVAADRPPYFLTLPAGAERLILAPRQYLRERQAGGDASKPGPLRTIPTLYIDVDLVRTYNISEDERTFFADFYLTIQPPADDPIAQAAAKLENIDFANAYLDLEGENGRQISWQAVSDGETDQTIFPPGIKVYRVSGRFFFTPRLRRFPFDSQRFRVDIKPSRIAQPFLIQPPPSELRDNTVDSERWNLRQSVVTIESSTVPIVDTLAGRPTVAPYYEASFAWVMKRDAKDFFLRALVPLGFIVLTSYLSIFISREKFEAIVTIQVTGLLSSVALYLSVPQAAADSTTISDWIFMFSYTMISIMIAISICRVNKYVARRIWLTEALRALHIALIIPVVLAFTVYSLADVGDFVQQLGLVEPSEEDIGFGG